MHESEFEKLIAAMKETKKETQIDGREKRGEEEKWRLRKVVEREDTEKEIVNLETR